MTDEEKNDGSIELVKNTKAGIGKKAKSLRDNPEESIKRKQ